MQGSSEINGFFLAFTKENVGEFNSKKAYIFFSQKKKPSQKNVY